MGKNTNGIFTKDVEWPINAPSLPLDNAPEDDASVGLHIGFKRLTYGEVSATVYDAGKAIDMFVGVDFTDVYDRVRDAYPQAIWVNNGQRGKEHDAA